MSYQSPPGGQGQGYNPAYNQPPNPYPHQGHSPYPPQQAYGAPSPMQNQQHPYPPQGQYPQQGGYPPPTQQGYSYPQQQQQYGAPQYGQSQGYPPQQPPYGAPPQQYPPQQQPYGAPQGQYPSQQQGYGAPPPGQYGVPPQQHGMPSPYGAPAYSGHPAPPTPGYEPNAHQRAPHDMYQAAGELRDAMKGFGTNEAKLIRVLTSLPEPRAPQMARLRMQYTDRFVRQNLLKDIEKETSGYFREGLMALVRGPLEQDVSLLNRAIAGMGTKESFLNDVLLGRSNADINAIKNAYRAGYNRDLLADVRGDLSMKTERLFDFVLAATRAEESAPVIPQQVDADASELHRATEGVKLGADQTTVCQILASRSDGQLRAINHRYQEKYRRSLDDVLRKEFSGHMEDALRLMLARAVDRAKSDADRLEDAMKGMGTKDELLVNRVVRLYWDRNHCAQVKGAYRRFYKKELVARIKGETSGDYEKLMVACIE